MRLKSSRMVQNEGIIFRHAACINLESSGCNNGHYWAPAHSRISLDLLEA